MNGFSNSLFCTTNLGLIKFYLKLASENSSSKCLKVIDRAESQKLVAEFIIPAVEQTVTDCSNVGNWKDEKDFVLLKIHGWFFLSWVTTTVGDTAELIIPIGTVFYLEVLRICSFQKFLVQCLSNVTEETLDLLIQDIVRTCKHCEGKDELLLELTEQSLLQLGDPKEMSGKKIDNKLCHILTKIAFNLEQLMQVNILVPLRNGLNKLLAHFKNVSSPNLTNVLTKKLSIIEFNERIDEFMTEAGLSKSTAKTSLGPNKETVEESLQPHVKAILCLVRCINHVITGGWKSFFTSQSTDHGNEMINYHGLLFDIFKSCKSLQALDILSCNELREIVDVLQPYFEQHMTMEEKMCIEDISSDHDVSECNDLEIAVTKGILEDKMQHALFQIEENLPGDEMCFEWLLLTEELYLDERWLKCVRTHAKTFVSIKIVRMLLDVLSVFQEFDILQDGAHSNIYNSLKKAALYNLTHEKIFEEAVTLQPNHLGTFVILELLPKLSLLEQREVVLYNFELTCLHFESYQHHSFFMLPGHDVSRKDILTATMNKLVNRTDHAPTVMNNDVMNDDVMNDDVMNGFIQSCLVAPYLTLKELLTEVSRHNGYEKVVCQLFQRTPWLVSLGHKDDDRLIIQVLRQVMSSLVSKKQEEQYLKLIEALMQRDHETKTLVAANEISRDLVIPLLTNEDDDIVCPTLALNILIKCLSCPLISTEQQPHWIVDQQPLQLLFVLLEMYQDCEQFWEDWVTASREDSMDRNDVALDEAWNEINVILKIVEEYLVPLLTEDVKREPCRYHDYVASMQDHLQDWITSMLIVPLLRNDVFNECKIKLPNTIITLMSSHFNVEPIKDKESAHSFWIIYFKSCALSDEVCGIYRSKLKESHSHETEAVHDDCEGIIRALATILPFSSWTQWQRMINITLEMVKYKYLILREEWKDDLAQLPNISNSGENTVHTSEVLVLILLDMSRRDWATSYVWNITLKKYVSTMKEITLAIGKEDIFEVTCHLLAHLAYITSKIVPQDFQENVSIVLLDLFNQCLASAGDWHYLQGIIDMVSLNQLRLTLTSKMDKILSGSN